MFRKWASIAEKYDHLLLSLRLHKVQKSKRALEGKRYYGGRVSSIFGLPLPNGLGKEKNSFGLPVNQNV